MCCLCFFQENVNEFIFNHFVISCVPFITFTFFTFIFQIVDLGFISVLVAEFFGKLIVLNLRLLHILWAQKKGFSQIISTTLSVTLTLTRNHLNNSSWQIFGYVFVWSLCWWQSPSEQNFLHLIRVFVTESALTSDLCLWALTWAFLLWLCCFGGSQPAAADAAVSVPWFSVQWFSLRGCVHQHHTGPAAGRERSRCWSSMEASALLRLLATTASAC